MENTKFMLDLAQVKNTPIRNCIDLDNLYNRESLAQKLATNIGKLYSFKADCGKGNKSEEKFAKDSGMKLIKEKLLSFGGTEVVYPRCGEEDVELILNRGQLWISHGTVKMPGIEGQCHYNASSLWHKNRDKKVYLATGYALSENGMWYQHSWCLHKNPKSVNVIETTSPKRLAYYGYAMTDEEAENFYFENR